MSLTSYVVDGVRRFMLFFHTTDDALTALKRTIDTKLIIPEEFCKATLKYQARYSQEASPDNPYYYPLKFYNKTNTQELWISSVSAGYHGTGPQGTIKALEMMGFSLSYFQKEKILNTQNINMTIKKATKSK